VNGHSRRVARHATMIARGLGLPGDQVARIRAAAAVHDVGKLLTPKAILNNRAD
jgi:HD-GYP domain-containing protein (c-di-GMP phosphodiesterase class II)